MISLRIATVADAAIIRMLAEATWWPTYLPIVAAGQVRYMLDKIYRIDHIAQQIRSGEQIYVLLSEDKRPVAFAAYAPRQEDSSIYKLHKLYCLPETQGKGYGRILIQHVEQEVKNAGKNILELNVNRHNDALSFYRKMGFAISREEDIDIGTGFFMNDYVLRKIL